MQLGVHVDKSSITKFSIEVPNKTINLRASSEKERDEWITAIIQEIQKWHGDSIKLPILSPEDSDD
jgi:hypothetical protein